MSSGKVKCTCGWSWNKSDSSKKDMYICHECGRDNSNNMKNGGWLDNYNDSQASASDGMVGDGYSNVGRNYSPAWGGQFQMGGSIPGTPGFSYARTNDPAPSEGPYAKKTMPSAQTGTVVESTSVKKPKIVKGKSKPAVKFDSKKFAKDFNLGLTPQERALKASVDKEARSEELRRWTSSAEYQNAVKAQKAAEKKAILAQRKANIKKADSNVLNSWSAVPENGGVFNPSNWTRQNVADAAAGLGDKARLFPNDPDNFVDDWLNPAVMIGNMASDLGSAPLRAQQEDSYMPYATSIGLPLLVGGLEGIGANTTRQFVSNIANPFNIVPGYRSAENAIAKSIGKQLQRKTALPILGNYEVPSISQSIGKYKTYVPEAEKGLEPYISQVGESGISREEEVFRNVMGPEYRGAKELENTKFLDQNGNVISNPNTTITNRPMQQGFYNPLETVDKVIPRPPYPGMIIGMEGSWNNLSPLNLIPGYGNKLSAASSHPNFVGFRKFGNSIQDVIESQSLRPKGTGVGSSQVMSEGNWAEPGKVNENYSGVFEATMNPQIEGSNIKLEKWRNRNGIVGTTQEGNVAIPLTDPGLSFNRRLPFSNRYVSIDKQKLIDDQFQLATQLPHLQSLIEKYGLWAGGAGAAGYFTGGSEGAKENINTFNDYTINPIIDQVKRQMESSPLNKKKNGGWLNKYEQAQNGYQTGDKPILGGGKYYTTTDKVVDWGTPEYESAYNRGEVLSDDGVPSEVTLQGGVLPELVLQNNYKRGFWEQYRDKILDENRDAGPLGAAVGVPLSAVTSLPQLAMMKGFTGEMQRPSEAIGFNNDEGVFANPISFGKHASNFLLDAVTDPTNLIGAGVLTKENALAKIAASKESGLLSNAYKLNPKAITHENFNNSNSFYRQIDTPTFNEGVKSGLIKGKQNINKTQGEGIINLNKSFGDDAYYFKGKLYSPQRADYIYEVNKGEEFFKPRVNNKDYLKKGVPYTVENTNVRVSKTPIPLEEATIYKKHWLQGYKEVPKQEEGGIIKDDMGQWDYPGEITEISGDTMATHGYGDIPLYVVPNVGKPRMVYPNTGNHKFPGATKFTEYPIAEDGIQTTTDNTTIPNGKAFLNKLKEEAKAKKKIDIREPAPTAVNDNIQNASRMAANADAARVKDVRNSNRVAAEKAKAQAEAQKKFNALSKEEQERAMYDYYNQQQGTISEYTPDSMLSKLDQSMIAPFTALKDLYQNGEVRDNLLKSIINNPETANAYDAAYLGTLGYAAAPTVASAIAAAPAAISPYTTMIGNSLATDAVIGGNTITGLNLGNIINAGFATHGLMNIAPDTEAWANDPTWGNAGHVAMDMLEMLPAVGPTAKTLGEGFGYVRNKGAQAANKISEVVAPTYDKAKTLASDMRAVIAGEKNTIEPKIQAIHTAEHNLLTGKEYAKYNDELRELNKRKWAIEGKVNSTKSKANLAELNSLNDRISKLKKRVDIAGQFRVNEQGLVQSGKDTSLGLRTGSTDIIDLQTGEAFPISTSVPSNDVIHTLEGDQVVKSANTITLPQASPVYYPTVKKNINFIETQIPGSVVFGSAKNVAEAEIPHIIGDYDVLMSQTQYEKFAKTNPSVGNNGFAELHNIPGAAKGIDPIDINVIQEKAGKAVGTRALELFKQIAPDEYYAAAKQAIKSKSEIKIPYSSQELIDMTNPTTKSIVDAYESTKPKHLNKIDAIINYGKPEVVSEGQEQFVKSLVGSKGSIGHQFPLEQLSNTETNLEILEKIGFIGNKELVAANPERMQLAINDYYINNSILARQVDLEKKVDIIEKAIKEYKPGAGGGAVKGIGQNHVTLGHPFHGDGNVISMKQLGMTLDTSDPVAYINSIEHQVSGEKLFNEEEIKILSNIIDDIKGLDDISKITAKNSQNTSNLIENLPYSEAGKEALYEFARKTNRTVAKKIDSYGNSNYASTLRDFDDAIDAMQYQLLKHDYVKPIKSFQQRAEAASYANNAPVSDITLLPKQYKAIKGYVEGGIQRASDRLKMLSEQRKQIYDDITAISDKAYSKKYKDEIERLKEFRAKLDKEIDDMDQLRRDLRERYVHLRDLEEKMKTAGILGGGTVALGVIGTVGYKQEMKYRKELNERLKKMTKEEREEYKKSGKREERNSSGRTDKRFVDKAIDWLSGKNQNGGTITKAKDGSQLVKLDQLTNFTNYNKPQPGGWLDKYN